MKKVLIIIGIIVVLIIVGFVVFNTMDKGERDISDIFNPEGQYSTEPFSGPLLGSGNVERDGVFSSLEISPTNPDIVFVGTETNGIFRSTDGGDNWTWLREGIWHTDRAYPEVYDIKIDPIDENIVYAAMTNGPQSPDREKAAGFYISYNAGESWERRINGLPNTAGNSLAISLENGQRTIFIGLDGEDPSSYNTKAVEGGIYKSLDQGESWQKVSIPEQGEKNRFSHISIHKKSIFSSGIRFKGDESKSGGRQIDPENSVSLIRSTDLGNDWDIVSPSDTFCYYFDVSKDGKTIIFTDGISGNGFKSTDAGESWQKTNISFSNKIKISPFDSNFVIFANGNQLSKSTDGMVSQNQVANFGNNGTDDIEYTNDREIIYAAGDGYRVYKSKDSGNSFAMIADLRTYIEEMAKKE